jgi:hypothetical protein
VYGPESVGILAQTKDKIMIKLTNGERSYKVAISEILKSDDITVGEQKKIAHIDGCPSDQITFDDIDFVRRIFDRITKVVPVTNYRGPSDRQPKEFS